MIKILLTTLMTILVLTGCNGCISVPGVFKKHKADSLHSELNISKFKETAVIVPLSGAVSEEWAVDVEKALQNPRYDLVVLWIESPGGSVTETKLLTHRLKVFQKKYNKPIYVYSERILASGAYWVASTFEKIVVSPAGHVGSIGVYMVRKDYSGLYDMLRLKFHYIASDSAKVMGNDATPMTDQERAHWQMKIYELHVEFMNHVWAYRTSQLINAYKFRNLMNVTTRQDTMLVAGQFRRIANGVLYNSRYAISVGLIDGVMYFDEFIKALQAGGYATVTANGKDITEFYPFSARENRKRKMQQKVWEHLQTGQK